MIWSKGMSKKRDEILAALSGGPVPFRDLAHGRRAAFHVAYLQLLREGVIQESGGTQHHSPKYSGLKGATFPGRRPALRLADVRLLVRSGMSEADARKELEAASEAGEAAYVARCEAAYDRIMQRGSGLTFQLPDVIRTKC
jgi:hypothetical protein